MIKGLLVLLAVFCLLIALLVWAKSRPAPQASAALPVLNFPLSCPT
ncbi:hypothetical protein [Litoreibacter arenae]|uniref:Uncharacterized protein n=1 Tax=Litoreibacter arenae DSM 19593 TaxID=1123360 RepID=S9QPJ7_9RHOB|nr:hypothetical protein [Litoreibacter arenae]EPX81513.1 hypothetical protein thalar_00068 [Litoreibacter arenae DSM 19593]